MTLMESIVIGLGKPIKNAENENIDNNKEQIMIGMNKLLQMLLGIEYEVKIDKHFVFLKIKLTIFFFNRIC
jgi:hypothetical protein